MEQISWQKLETVFNEAVVLPSEQRLAFVSSVCGNDNNLRRNVLSLLEEAKKKTRFFSSPVYESGVKLLASEVDGLLAEPDFAGYKLLKIIGRGGTGVVFLAEDAKLERQVAVKILPYTLANDSLMIRRFQQEARAACSVSHPNVAHIYDFGEDKGRFYLAMEYADGRTLREIFKTEKQPVAQSLEIAIQIAKALEAAHRRGIIHRDIKPENVILVTEDKTVKVLDFGLAKYLKNNLKVGRSAVSFRTDPNFIIGTTAYMSPEQIHGETLDARTDLWSCGVLLFEMLLGKRPFDGSTPVDLQTDILHSEPPFTAKIEEFPLLKAILCKLLTKNSADRYQTAADLLGDLRNAYHNLSENHYHQNIHLSFADEKKSGTTKFQTVRQSLARFIKKIMP